MAVLVLLVVLALVLGGCVCVVWAEFGGPPWVRAVAAVMRGVGTVLHHAQKSRRRSSNGDD
ncbi:hypothetical protein ABZS84_21465 [Streptomyces sp. NPDC005481]|uniref:hypothetical protein n=1 Tax=Streptomyces sp. NPDC005481 TaxID=3154881 RepID=UPI0033A770D4